MPSRRLPGSPSDRPMPPPSGYDGLQKAITKLRRRPSGTRSRRMNQSNSASPYGKCSTAAAKACTASFFHRRRFRDSALRPAQCPWPARASGSGSRTYLAGSNYSARRAPDTLANSPVEQLRLVRWLTTVGGAYSLSNLRRKPFCAFWVRPCPRQFIVMAPGARSSARMCSAISLMI
jgi:hypothetical protein